jgi:hypothetical protein
MGQPCFRFFVVLHSAMLTRSQILRALRASAHQLGRAPTRAEFLRLTSIHYGRLIPHFPDGYRSAVRAAGLSPDRGGLRIDTAGLLTDWAQLARKKGRVPTRDEYEREGRHASASLETRFHRWTQVPSAFLKFAESMGLSEQWSDVIGIIHNGPMPKRGGGRRWLKGWKRNDRKKNGSERNGVQKNDRRKQDSSVLAVASASPLSPPQAGVSVLPPPLHGMKCVRFPCWRYSSLCPLFARLSLGRSILTARCSVRLWICPASCSSPPMKWESSCCLACFSGGWVSSLNRRRSATRIVGQN